MRARAIRRLCFVIIVGCAWNPGLLSVAADSTVHSIGIAATSPIMNGVGTSYTCGSEKSMWRIWGITSVSNTYYANGPVKDWFHDPGTESILSNFDEQRSTNTVSLHIGHQWRAALSERVSISIEVDALVVNSTGYDQMTQTTGDTRSTSGSTLSSEMHTSKQYNIGLGLPFGVHFKIAQHVECAVEFTPSFSYFSAATHDHYEYLSKSGGSSFDNPGSAKGLEQNLGLSNPLFSLSYVW